MSAGKEALGASISESLDDSVVILVEVKSECISNGEKKPISCDTSTSPFVRPAKKILLSKTPKTVRMADAFTSITPNRFSEPIPMNLMPTMSSSEAYEELIKKTNIHINNMKETKRPIVIDGSNVAVGHGQSSYNNYKSRNVFSCRGILLAVNYFINLGHKNVIAIVPQNRRKILQQDGFIITDRCLLEELKKRNNVIFTPARDIKGKTVVSYDDRFIISLAANTGGVIVSNDQYRNLLKSGEERSWIEAIENRLLQFVFAKDLFMIPDDPLGRNGPTLTQFLSFPTGKGNSKDTSVMKKSAKSTVLNAKNIEEIPESVSTSTSVIHKSVKSTVSNAKIIEEIPESVSISMANVHSTLTKTNNIKVKPVSEKWKLTNNHHHISHSRPTAG